MSETVDNTDVAEETPATDESVAQAGGLDDLLNEYESEKPKVEQPTTESDNSELLEYVREQRAERTEEEINAATKSIAEAMDVKVGEGVIRAMLETKARGDERVVNAFLNRKSNPKGWDKVSKALAREFSEEFPDPSATSDADAVVSAVHSASTRAPEPETAPDFSSMSDAEFFKMKAEMKG